MPCILIHGALQIDGATVMLADDFPEMSGGTSTTPKALGGNPVTIHLTVTAVRVVMPLEDQFCGDRYGVVRDPFGHQGSLRQPVREVSYDEIQQAVSQM